MSNADQKAIMGAIDRLATLRHFPTDEGARMAIAKEIVKMCSTTEQVIWLGERMMVLYDSWPGPHELRAVLCSKFAPKDGIEADSRDPRYLEWGIPSEKRAPDEHEPIAIGPSSDPETRALVKSVADRKRLN